MSIYGKRAACVDWLQLTGTRLAFAVVPNIELVTRSDDARSKRCECSKSAMRAAAMSLFVLNADAASATTRKNPKCLPVSHIAIQVRRSGSPPNQLAHHQITPEANAVRSPGLLPQNHATAKIGTA